IGRFIFFTSIAVVLLGFSVAQLRSLSVSAPVLEKKVTSFIAGRVLEVQNLSSGKQRVILVNLEIKRLKNPPLKVRISLTKYSEKVFAGQTISLRAVLMPPSSPSMPEAFQFQRMAWFQQLGAVGYAVSRWKEVKTAPEVSFFNIAQLRNNMTERIREILPDINGAVATALISGERAAIPKKLYNAYRDSGLAHLLSISGLHMSIVAGLVFFGVRAFLALIPAIAVRYPIKKWTAGASIAITFVYLLISGMRVPTQRAFIMTTIVLLAVLFDRKAISMRLVAIAAIAVLLIHPEAITGASFQMSFAAVIALIAAYESGAGRLQKFITEIGGFSFFRIVIVYFAGVVVTDLIASVATTPFAVYHFNRINVYTLLGNFLAAPIVGLWVMPASLLAVLLMPFGLDAWLLVFAGQGISAINDITAFVSSLPYASIRIPAMPLYGLVMISIGGVWLCLWRKKWRLLGLVPFIAGLITPFLTVQPDILVNQDGTLFAVQDNNGKFILSSTTGNKFAREIWLERAGQQSPDKKTRKEWRELWSGVKENPSINLNCDSLGCIYKSGKHTIAFIKDGKALIEDCQNANIVISPIPVRADCSSANIIIDRFTLWKNGAYAIWLEEEKARVVSGLDATGERLWTLKRGR
ncbi:MAG: ComEC/Rec2 family competence protein, partial [Alphaproteobacteria bacterium]|nr:ComEC/Rec2 family competence protein [Alphaproteobacteria bacterium]